MPGVERTIVTRASVDRVWDFMADFTTTEQWDPPTVSTTRVSGDGGVGTTYDNTSRILGHETDIVYTVVEFEPPRLLRLAGESKSFTCEDTILISASRPEADGDGGADVAGGTTLVYTADFTFTGVTRLASPLLGLGLEKIGDEAAAQMTRCLDALGTST